MTTAVTAFVCDFCPRKSRWSSRAIAKKHESRCFFNPIRRACMTCAYFTMEDTGIDEGDRSKSPCCGLDLLPIPATDTTPERRLNFNCEQWEPK